MRIIRLVYAWCFAGAALMLAWSEYTVTRSQMHVLGALQPSLTARLQFLSIPLAFVALFLIAWWTVLKRWPSAGAWAITASCALAALGFLLIQASSPFLGLGWTAFAAGAAGALVFAFTGRADQPKRKRMMRSPRPGDGTSRLVNRFIGVAATLVAITVSDLWWRWADAQGLGHTLPSGIIAQIVLVVLAVVFIHEFGHAAVGMAFGMKLTGAGIGPLAWFNEIGHWTFRFRASGLKSMLGYVRMVPTETGSQRRQKIMQVAAGPVAGIVTGLAAAAVVLRLPRTRWEDDWLVLSLFATISVLEGIFNLIPFSIGRSGYSDGAKLYQLIASSIWGEYQLLLGVLQSSGVTPTRPRDYDIEAIRRVAAALDKGLEQAYLELAAYSCFLDRGELAQAAEAAAHAETICRDFPDDVPAEWYGPFVFANAFLRRDPVAARAWWDRFENQKKQNGNNSRCISLAALLWSENRLKEAEEAWKKGEAWARGLPDSGYAEAERRAARLLRKALDESASAQPSTGPANIFV